VPRRVLGRAAGSVALPAGGRLSRAGPGWPAGAERAGLVSTGRTEGLYRFLVWPNQTISLRRITKIRSQSFGNDSVCSCVMNRADIFIWLYKLYLLSWLLFERHLRSQLCLFKKKKLLEQKHFVLNYVVSAA